MPESASIALPLLVVASAGALGAIFGSVFTREERRAEGQRSAFPYIGFIIGAAAGTATAVLWWL